MMRRGLLASALLAVVAGGVVAQDAAKPFRAIDYPIEVRKALSYAPLECRRQGGGKVTFAPDTVRKVDLNGDGRDDYVVTLQDTECSTYQSAFCGTAGCSMDFLVTLPDGRIRNVFSDRIRGYEILPGEGKVRFQLHGSYCGGSGNPSCFKEHRITGKPFAFTEPKEDAATLPSFKASDYPLEVRKTLSYGPVNCRDVEGGGKAGFAPDTVRKVDFNGDGRDDYIVSFEKTTCGGLDNVLCGTGGCMTDFLVTLPNGKLRSVFADQIHGYEILPGKPRKVRFWIHHSYCDASETGCFKDHRVTYKPFTPKR